LDAPPLSNAVRIHETPGDRSRVLLVFLASTLSAALGRNGYYIASVWILVEAGYGSASVATLLAIVSLVELVASPLVGTAADRFDRRRLNIAADLGRFVVLLATTFTLLYLDVFTTLCLSAILFSFCDRVALTTAQSIIPLLTRGADLAASNSTVFFIMQFGSLGAALLTCTLLSKSSPALAFIVLALFFLISAGCLSSIRLGSVARDISEAKNSASNFEPGLLRLFAAYSLLYGSAVLVTVMGSSFVFEEQKGTAVDFGYLEAAWSAGSLVGALLLVRLTRAISAHTLHLMLLGLTALVLMSLIPLRAPWTLIAFATLGFLYNLGRISIEVTLQSLVSDNALGRAKGLMHSVAVALGLLIFSIASVLEDSVFPSTIFFCFGVVLLISISGLSIGIAQPKGQS
jgi:MFS family permease